METGAIPEKYRKNVVTDLPKPVEGVGHASILYLLPFT
jgi:hypothetical protein